MIVCAGCQLSGTATKGLTQDMCAAYQLNLGNKQYHAVELSCLFHERRPTGMLLQHHAKDKREGGGGDETGR